MRRLANINMADVKEHYLHRVSIHRQLVWLLCNNRIKAYVQLAIGNDDISGNYSASDRTHDLRPAILSSNKEELIFSFAKALYRKNCKTSEDLKSLIYNEYNLPYIKISIGSEMAMMVRPKEFWVANIRTVWSYILIEKNFHYEESEELLELYNSHVDSEIDYSVWREIYSEIGKNLIKLSELGITEAKRQKVVVTNYQYYLYLWSDAIANAMYEDYYDD